MRSTIMWQFPTGFVRLKRALDFWGNGGQWDTEGFDWITARHLPHPLRSALIDGDLTASVMSEDGRLDVIPVSLWRGMYLWGEAYSTGLVNVHLDRHQVTGYLCIEQAAVNKLWKGRSESKPQRAFLAQEVIGSVQSECPPLGLVVQAVATNVETGNTKVVQNWLRTTWPEVLHAVWPTRNDDGDKSFPSLALQVSAAIRTFNAVRPKWTAPPPDEPTLAALLEWSPLLAAALEVFRRCKRGDLDFGPTGRVLPSKAELEIRALLEDIDAGDRGRRLLKCIAQLTIPAEKVSGGGRQRVHML